VPVVWIPPLLRELTAGQEQVTVPGETVRQVVESLDGRYPGIGARLRDEEGRLRPGISVAVDGKVSRLRMRQPLTEKSEVHFLPSISGGQR